MGSFKLVCVLFVFMSHMPAFLHGGISVHFKSGPTVYVALGRELVLEAVFVKNPEDKIDIVTWEKERGNENIRISGNSHGSRISLEKDNSLLRVNNVMKEDVGTYKITVTDHNGHQIQASTEVRIKDEPPKAFVTHFLECGVDNNNAAQWDRPQFSWLVNGIEVNNTNALLANGSQLNISQWSEENYTCVVNSSLGTSKARYETPVRNNSLKGTTAESRACQDCRLRLLIVGIVILLCIAVVLLIIMLAIRQNRHSKQSED